MNQDPLTRRPAESNRFPGGNIRVSSDGQNRLATTSRRLRNKILTEPENKNNRFVSKVVVYGSLGGNAVSSLDTLISIYSFTGLLSRVVQQNQVNK